MRINIRENFYIVVLTIKTLYFTLCCEWEKSGILNMHSI